MSVWKRLSGLLILAAMLAAPYAGEYAKNRIDAVHSARAYARAPEPSGLTPALAGFGGALGPTPARISGGETRWHDSTGANGPKVVGDANLRRQIRQAIDLLREKDPEGYDLVRENIREIRPDPNVIKETGGWAAVNPATGVVRWYPLRADGPEAIASTLVHEAMHVYQYRHGLPEGEKLPRERADETFQRLTSK